MWKLLKRSLKTGRLSERQPVADRSKDAQTQHHSFKQSWHIRHLDCGSCNGCDWEMSALLNPIYDLQQYGFDFVASPRHADLLMCTGSMTSQLLQAATTTYEATPHPKQVIAVGDCAIHGNVFRDAYATNGGVGKVLPVQVEIPGCPPSPEEILKVLIRLERP